MLTLASIAMTATARAADDPAAKILSVSPTVLFVKEKDVLWQQAEMVVENTAAEQELSVDVKTGSVQRPQRSAAGRHRRERTHTEKHRPRSGGR